MRLPATLAVLLLCLAIAGCTEPDAAAQSEGSEATQEPGAGLGGGDLPPSATVQANPSSGKAPLRVVVSLGARDPEGAAVAWTLDFGDGSPPRTGTQLPVAVEHLYDRVGAWPVTFTATDGALESEAKVTIRTSATQVEQGPPTTGSSPPPPPPAPPPPQSSSTTTTSQGSTSTSASTSSTTTSSSTSTTTSSSSSTSASTTSTQSETTTTTSEPTSSTSQTATSDPSSSTSQTSTSSSASGSTSESATSSPSPTSSETQTSTSESQSSSDDGVLPP